MGSFLPALVACRPVDDNESCAAGEAPAPEPLSLILAYWRTLEQATHASPETASDYMRSANRCFLEVASSSTDTNAFAEAFSEQMGVPSADPIVGAASGMYVAVSMLMSRAELSPDAADRLATSILATFPEAPASALEADEAGKEERRLTAAVLTLLEAYGVVSQQ